MTATFSPPQATITCGNCGRIVPTGQAVLEADGWRCTACRAAPTPTDATDAPAPATVYTPIRTDPESGVAIYTCSRHPKEETRLTCGRCDQPICPRCMVYTSTGLRCPDCIYGRRTKTSAPITAAEQRRNFRAREADNARTRLVSQNDVILALGAGVLVATLFGGVWGYLLGSGAFPYGYLLGGLHLIPEIALAAVVSETVLRVCGLRRGSNLAIVAAISTVWGLIMPLVVTYSRDADGLLNAVTMFRTIGTIVFTFFRSFNILRGFTSIFDAGGPGPLVALVPLWWIMAVVLVVLRLRR